MIRLTSFLWVWFQCVCSLMPSCNTYRLTWVSLTFVWGISSRLLQQSAAAAPYLGSGVSPHHRPFWPWTWNSSSRPSCARAATPCWRWGRSSWPLPLASRRGVAPPGRWTWPWMWGLVRVAKCGQRTTNLRFTCVYLKCRLLIHTLQRLKLESLWVGSIKFPLNAL